MFTHLHVHSGFSAHYGVSTPAALVAAAADANAGIAALTDCDGLYGACAHVQACIDAELAPVLGVDLAVLDEQLQPLGRVVLLAHGGTAGSGYAALCRAISAAHATPPAPRNRHMPATTGSARDSGAAIPRDTLIDIIAARPHLSVLLGPDSDVGQLVEARRLPEARHALTAWRRRFTDIGRSDLLRVEIVCWLAEPGLPGSVTPATRLLGLAEAAGVEAVLTNQVRYATPAEAVTADVAEAARTLHSLDELDLHQALPVTGQAWLKPAAQMQRIARMVVDIGHHHTTAVELLGATERLAERCALDPAADLGWVRPRMPEASVIGISGNPDRALRQRAYAGIGRRYPGASVAQLGRIETRLDHELQTVRHLGFAPYFLTVARVVDLIRTMGIRVQARGSGVGSLLNHLLDISVVDPIDNGLLWERFLSEQRRTLPDIDLDVEAHRRHDIYRRIFDEFGADRVTLMSMTNTYRSRGAVRDAGLALGLPPARIDAIAKELWRFSARSFRRALAEKPELSTIARQVHDDPRLDLLVELTERLDSLPRHVSMHPCGVILSDRSLLSRTPVQPSGLGLPMSQYDKHSVDPMGLIKLDVLGVRMQSAMSHAVGEIERCTGQHIDLDAVPLDDEPTFETIRSTHTLGIFQIESPGQIELIGKLQPEVFNDLTIDISLFRPGPMKNDMPLQFLQARHGEIMPDYIHPRLRPILRETKGVVVFHEQVMRLLDELTGCGLAMADVYRRWLADDRRLDEIEQLVRTQGAERGFPAEVIERAWRIIKGFGSFGFAKAHGAAFALPTYQSAWLKTHHPAAFLAGLLTHDPGMWPKDLLVAEARRLGVPLLPLDVQHSGLEYRLEPLPTAPDGQPSHGIRLPLDELVGSSAAERRRITRHQPFSSLQDLRDRVRPRRTTFEALARVGALDAFIDYQPARRHELLAHIRALTAQAIRVPETQLAFELPLPLPARDNVHALDLRGRTQVDLELEHLRLGVSGHAIERFHPVLQRLGVTPTRDLLALPGGTPVLIAGLRRATNTPPMRGGQRVVFVSLDDGTGLGNVVFFHDAQQRIRNPIFRAQVMLVQGVTRRSGPRGISVTGQMAWSLPDLTDDDVQRIAAAQACPPAPAAPRHLRLEA